MTEFKQISEDYSLTAINKKCPTNGTRLFRSPDNSPYTRDECYQKCEDTQDCAYFTFGEGENLKTKWQGLCLLCSSDAVLATHNGFNSYEI